MFKRLALAVAAALAIGTLSAQSNGAANEKNNGAAQSQPAVHASNSIDKQTNSETNDAKPDNNPPASDTATAYWWKKPEWWTLIVTALAAGIVGWQSWETRKAAQASLLGAQASSAQVEHAKSTQRAQLSVELAPPEFNLEPKLGGYPVDFRITVYGTTRAYVLNDSIIVYLSKSKRTAGAWKSFGLPRNLTPEDSPYDGKTLIHDTEFLPEAETDMNKFYSVRRGEDGYTLYADGQIYYRDIFGDEWVLEIDRYWDTMAKMWGPYGSGRHDRHRKASQPNQDKAPNLN
ncbi:tetratricopeptide repeat protein [Granulicella sp. WH15]|uniref:tetratricopeptide repeat protein n=1 Tax=Granulicella sp. WH15 TaxID=2602070 RepID=UPI001366E128|nr:tetratricopeptide repeat protein [Granulicella sp. WH15]QHN02745.1 tetratricopeptide repeat protein [Granulicella sp. WH15]